MPGLRKYEAEDCLPRRGCGRERAGGQPRARERSDVGLQLPEGRKGSAEVGDGGE